MVVSSVKGCVSAGQEGNSYSQNAELRWDNRSVKQGMKYQVLCSTLNGKTLISLTFSLSRDCCCFEEILLCFCVVSRRVRGECTAFRLMLAWTKCLPHPVLHTHSWRRFRPTSGIAWSTRCCWASAPHSLWVQTCFGCFLSHAMINSLGFSPTSEDTLVRWK